MTPGENPAADSHPHVGPPPEATRAGSHMYQGGHYQPPPAPAWPAVRHQPPPPRPTVVMVTTSGMPTWMVVFYAVGGVCTCGLLWIVGAMHWWFTRRATPTGKPTVVYPPR